jgi:hypothetical protein
MFLTSAVVKGLSVCFSNLPDRRQEACQGPAI